MILLCAAVEEELAAILPTLRRDGAFWRGDGVVAAAIGIGPVDAALGALEALAVRPRAAVLVGTCGALPGSGLEIGQAVVVERSILTSSDAAAGFSYVPGPAAVEVRADSELVKRSGLQAVRCATTVAITKDAGHAAALARTCQIEHLEAFAFLRAAERLHVPATCVLGIANDVGPDAHAQWRTNGARAAAAALEAFRSLA